MRLDPATSRVLDDFQTGKAGSRYPKKKSTLDVSSIAITNSSEVALFIWRELHFTLSVYSCNHFYKSQTLSPHFPVFFFLVNKTSLYLAEVAGFSSSQTISLR